MGTRELRGPVEGIPGTRPVPADVVAACLMWLPPGAREYRESFPSHLLLVSPKSRLVRWCPLHHDHVSEWIRIGG